MCLYHVDNELALHFFGIDRINKEFYEIQEIRFQVRADPEYRRHHEHPLYTCINIPPIVFSNGVWTVIVNIEDMALKYGRSVQRLMRYIQLTLGSIGVHQNRIIGVYSQFIVSTVLNALGEFHSSVLGLE